MNFFESPPAKGALCQVWLKLAQWFWRRFFLISSMYFCYFLIISPWKRTGAFIWTNLNPLHPRLCFGPSVVEIGSVVLEKKIFKFCQCFCVYFLIISPWKRAGPFIWKRCGQDTMPCQNPSKFDLEVKVQCRIGIMNVRDTSSNGDTLICQIWEANVKPRGRTRICTDRRTARQTDSDSSVHRGYKKEFWFHSKGTTFQYFLCRNIPLCITKLRT